MKEFKWFSISDLALGTWMMGGGYWNSDYSNDEAEIRAIRRAIELGITAIDTAEMYGNGHAEELVGIAIREFVKREDLFIITKVWPNHAKRDDVIKSAIASSRRLGTYIDLYLLHWPSNTPICETVNTFEELVDMGIIRYFGLSNFKPNGIEEAKECLRKYEIVAVENHYSLWDRSDRETVEYAIKNGMLYLSYTPIEKGRIKEDKILREIGRKYGKSAIQVALNWYINIPNFVPIVKASNISHLEEDAGSIGWRLSEEDWRTIDSYYK